MRVVRGIAVAMLASATVAACSDDVPAPVMPPEAAENTPAGAMAFARYYRAAQEYAYATGDAEPLSAASDANCVYCQEIIELTDGALLPHGPFDMERQVIKSTRVVKTEPTGTTHVLVTSSIESSTGSQLRDPSNDRSMLYVLGRKGSSWSMLTYTIAS